MKIKLTVLLAIMFMALHTFADDAIVNGKTIFTARCATCHKLGSVLLGPDLIDVDKRRSISWIISFVNSSTSVIKNGDKDATALFEKFNKIQMPEQPDLKEADIKNVVAYIKSQKGNIVTTDAPFSTPPEVLKNYQPLSIHNYGYIITYLGLVVILVAVLYLAVSVSAYKK